jgi:mRNA-degrading endonuclease RelE of RelBE toxin-antitoxin system
MPFNVIASTQFLSDLKPLAKKYPSIFRDVEALIENLEGNPFFESEPLGKDCYKIRMAITSKGRGKSGGARVISCVKVVANNVHLVSIYDKSDKENIADKELILRLKKIFEDN